MTTYLIGDIHGQLEKLSRLLQAAGLADQHLVWCGGNARLWFMGDFVDRGPDGVGVIELVMRLQAEAAAAGGFCGALLGNHEPLLLAAHRFGAQASGGSGQSFLSDWERNGGVASDLERLQTSYIDWISQLPAMALEQDRLLVHADALCYTRYGASIHEVNQALNRLLQGNDSAAWDRLLDDFSERDAFWTEDATGEGRALELLAQYGGQQIIHGHSPIGRWTRQPYDQVSTPLVYAGGHCINLDGGMYRGGPGFVYQLPHDGVVR